MHNTNQGGVLETLLLDLLMVTVAHSPIRKKSRIGTFQACVTGLKVSLGQGKTG